MRKRWWFYILLGLVFGLLDWYFLALLASVSQVQALNDAPAWLQTGVVVLMVAFNYGVWLLPAIPAAIHERKISGSLLKAALAAALVWSLALVGYYAWYAFLLLFVGLPNFDFMLFSNRHAPSYWADFWPPFKRAIVDQLLEWIGVALVGGALAGAGSAYLSTLPGRKKK